MSRRERFLEVCCAQAQVQEPRPMFTVSAARTVFLRSLLVGLPVAALSAAIAPVLGLFGMVAGLGLVPTSAIELWAERFPGNRNGRSAVGLYLLFWLLSTLSVAILLLNSAYVVAAGTEGYGPAALQEGLSGAGLRSQQITMVLLASLFLSWTLALASFSRVRRREREPMFDTFVVAMICATALGGALGALILLSGGQLFAAFGTLILLLVLAAIGTYLSVVLVYLYFWADVFSERLGRLVRGEG